MNATLGIAALWLLFAAGHLGLSSAAPRSSLVSRLGEKGFLALYSLVAFATFIPLVAYYFSHKHFGPVLWHVPMSDLVRTLLYAGNMLAFILMFSALVTPSPIAVGGKVADPRGVQLITRHGLFMGISLWALMHVVANGFASDVVFFGGFVVFSFIGCRHQDLRKLATGGEALRRFYARTPFFPFTGKETMRGLREISRPGVVLGVLVTVVLGWFHSRWFG